MYGFKLLLMKRYTDQVQEVHYNYSFGYYITAYFWI